MRKPELHAAVMARILRTTLVVAAAALSCVTAEAVDGFDQPGFDYANFSASSMLVCRNSCASDTQCKAWTWVKPGFQGPGGRCWLKSKVPALVKNKCCNSGARENILKRDVRAEDHTDRPGRDYRNFPLDSWKTCEASCANDRSCAAWAYAKPGVQGPRGRCWLKSGVPRPVDNPNIIAGVTFRSAASNIDPGTNQIPADE